MKKSGFAVLVTVLSAVAALTAAAIAVFVFLEKKKKDGALSRLLHPVSLCDFKEGDRPLLFLCAESAAASSSST